MHDSKGSRKSLAHEKSSAWSPLRHPIFRSLWIASVVSNVGTWMHSTATAWLMTSIAPSAMMVSLVQTASSLPIFLLALPAGALADVLDRRRLVLFTQAWMLAAAAALGFLTLAGLTTPWTLLALTLLLSLGTAMNAPAWQSIVPELVDRPEIPSAVALNSAGFNTARAIGPALGGFIVGAVGPGVAFLLNAASFLAVMAVLFFWKRPPRESTLPTERITGAIRTGLRYVRHDPALQAIIIRAAAFIICGSAQMALLPLIARYEMGLGSAGYGLLLGAFGVGAVAGAGILPWLRHKVSADMLAALMNIIFAATLALLPFVKALLPVWIILFVAGVAWLALLASFNSSMQSAVPSWVRGRAMAVYMIVFFGGIAGGSALWGAVAAATNISTALLVSALGLLVSLAATARFRLSAADMIDFTPSMHWPSPAFPINPHPEDGPVLVRVEYRIDPESWEEFGRAMRKLRRARLQGGAFRWNLFVDIADPEHYLESFIVESWLEHLRQHERLTVADLEVEREVLAFHKGDKPPVVTHLLARTLPEEE